METTALNRSREDDAKRDDRGHVEAQGAPRIDSELLRRKISRRLARRAAEAQRPQHAERVHQQRDPRELAIDTSHIKEKVDSTGLQTSVESGTAHAFSDAGLGEHQKGPLGHEQDGGRGAYSSSHWSRAQLADLMKQARLLNGPWADTFQGERWNDRNGAGAALGNGSGPSSAFSGGHGGRAGFSFPDSPSGALSKMKDYLNKKFGGDVDKMFNSADKDHDGKLSTDEVVGMMRDAGVAGPDALVGKYASEAVKKADTDGDGKVSADEAKTLVPKASGDDKKMPNPESDGGGGDWTLVPLGQPMNPMAHHGGTADGPGDPRVDNDSSGGGSMQSGTSITMGVTKGQDKEMKKRDEGESINFAVALKDAGWTDPKRD